MTFVNPVGVGGARPKLCQACAVDAGRFAKARTSRARWCIPVSTTTRVCLGSFFLTSRSLRRNTIFRSVPRRTAQQTAEIIKRFEGVVFQERPHCVVVVGDVNTPMACALVAKKLDIEVVHVEAGLRSFDRKMPEEINRVITDAISDLLLVTEESGVRNLLAEGVPPGRIDHVGNLMIDTLYANLARAKESSVPDQIGRLIREALWSGYATPPH